MKGPGGSTGEGGSGWLDVARADEMPEGDARLLRAGEFMVAVINVQGRYYAIEDRCSHDGFPLLGCGLDPEELLAGGAITCPRHGARFCIRTGEALAPPAWEPLRTFPVRISQGVIQVRP